MQEFDGFDWTGGTAEEHLAMVRTGSDHQVRALARSYDWDMFPEKVLGWIMAQKCIDLNTALTAFMNGDPERFNYMPKRHVPEEYRGAARVLDNICLRVNSGFYLAYPDLDLGSRTRIATWLAFQKADRHEGRSGRWILDETILENLLQHSSRPDDIQKPAPAQRKNFLRDILSPVFGLMPNSRRDGDRHPR